MIKTAITIGALSILVAGCVSNRPQPQPAAQVGGAKDIIRQGHELVLPDGTRVTPDPTGGFRLPNGDYVRRDRNGSLILPTGARCPETSSGYACP